MQCKPQGALEFGGVPIFYKLFLANPTRHSKKSLEEAQRCAHFSGLDLRNGKNGGWKGKKYHQVLLPESPWNQDKASTNTKKKWREDTLVLGEGQH